MKRSERKSLKQKRRLLAGLAAAPLLLPAVAVAQSYSAGATLWGQSCGGSGMGCHSPGDGGRSLASFQNRFTTVSAALNALNAAINGNGVMRGFATLTTTERQNVSAYMADWRARASVAASPSTTFTVSGINQTSTAATVTLTSFGRAPLVVNTNNGVELTGTHANMFQVQPVGNGCQAQTLPALNGTCQVTVTYRPTSTPMPSHTATIAFNHNGEPAPLESRVSLNLTGNVAGPSPAPAPPPPAPAPPPPAPSPAPAPTPSPTPAPAPSPSAAPTSGGAGALGLAVLPLLFAAGWTRRRRIR